MKASRRHWLIFTLLLPFVLPVAAQSEAPKGRKGAAVIDDFEAYQVGTRPLRWQINQGRKLVPLASQPKSEDEYFEILEEDGNKFVRVVTNGRAHRMLLLNGEHFEWDVRAYPRLRWDWRALQLPEGAREDKEETNDTGGAMYVTFSRDWLGRPRSIKYTYSSTLPVGTVTSYGQLKVMVVTSALDGIGTWQEVDRDVIADYRQLFGGNPPDMPIGIMVWSDSDTVKGKAVVDFDNVALMP